MNTQWQRALASRLGAEPYSGNGVDVWIAWFFASMLTLPLAGEMNLLVSILAALVILLRGMPHTAGAIDFSGSFWVCAMAIGSIVVAKGASWFWSIAPALTIKSTVLHLHFFLWVPLVWLFSRAAQPLEAMLIGVRVGILGLLMWSGLFWLRHGIELDALTRLEAGAQNPGVLGQLATVFVLWMGWLWTVEPRKGKLFWVLAAVCPVIAAGGRSHIVVMAVGLSLLGFMAVWRAKKSFLWNFWVLVLALGLIVGLIQALAPRMNDAWREVVAYQHDPAAAVGSSVGNRIGLYHVAWQAFPDAPWVGFGAGTSLAVVKHYSPYAERFAVARHYHQQVLQVVMETGLIGLLACMVALVIITRWMGADHRVMPYYLGLVGVTAGTGLFTGSLQQGLIHTFIVTALAVLGAQRLRATCLDSRHADATNHGTTAGAQG